MARSSLALAAIVVIAAPSLTRAQRADPKARAEGENTAGKRKIQVADLDAAAAHFRAAIALVPDPRYYFNLCYTLEKAGKLRDARVACEVVTVSGGEPLAAKARAEIDRIDAAIREGRQGPQGAGAGDTLADDEAVRPGQPIADSPRPPAGAARTAGGDAEPAPGSSPAGVPPAGATSGRPGVTYFGKFGIGAAHIEGDEGSALDLEGRGSIIAMSIGGGTDLWLGRAVALHLEGLIARRGFTVSSEIIDHDAALTYLDVVVALRLEPGRGRIRVFGVGGLYGSALASGEVDDGTGPTSTLAYDYGFLAGGGAVFGGYPQAISGEVRLQSGLADIAEFSGELRNWALLALVGYEL